MAAAEQVDKLFKAADRAERDCNESLDAFIEQSSIRHDAWVTAANALYRENVGLTNGNNTLTKQATNTNTELQHAWNQADNAERQCNELQQQLDTANGKLVESDTTTEALETEVEEQKKRLDEAQQSKKIVSDCKNDTVKRLQELKEELGESKGREESALATNSLLTEQSERLKTDVKNLEEEKLQLLAEVDAMVQEIQADNLNLERYRIEAAHHVNTIQWLSQLASEASKIEDESPTARNYTQDQTLRKVCFQLNDAMKRDHTQAEELRKLSSQMSDEKKRFREGHKRHKEAEEKLKSKYEADVVQSATHLHREIGTLRRSLEEVKEETVTMEEKREALQKKVQILARQVVDEKKKREAAERQRHRLQGELNASRVALKDEKESHKARKKSSDATHALVAQQSQEHSDARSQSEREKKAASVHSKAQATEVRKLQGEVQSLKDEAILKTSKISTLEREKSEAVKMINILRKEAQHSETSTTGEKLKTAKAEAKIESLRTLAVYQSQELKDSSADWEVERAWASLDRERQGKESEWLRKKLQLLEKEVESAKANAAVLLEAQNEKSVEQKQETEAARAESIRKVDELQSALDRLSKTAVKEKEQTASCIAEKEGLRKQLEQILSVANKVQSASRYGMAGSNETNAIDIDGPSSELASRRSSIAAGSVSRTKRSAMSEARNEPPSKRHRGLGVTNSGVFMSIRPRSTEDPWKSFYGDSNKFQLDATIAGALEAGQLTTEHLLKDAKSVLESPNITGVVHEPSTAFDHLYRSTLAIQYLSPLDRVRWLLAMLVVQKAMLLRFDSAKKVSKDLRFGQLQWLLHNKPEDVPPADTLPVMFNYGRIILTLCQHFGYGCIFHLQGLVDQTFLRRAIAEKSDCRAPALHYLHEVVGLRTTVDDRLNALVKSTVDLLVSPFAEPK